MAQRGLQRGHQPTYEFVRNGAHQCYKGLSLLAEKDKSREIGG